MNWSIVEALMTSASLASDGGRNALNSRAVIDLIPGAARCLLPMAICNSDGLVLMPACDGGQETGANGAASAGGDCFNSICLTNSCIASLPVIVFPCASLISEMGANNLPFLLLIFCRIVSIVRSCCFAAG